MHNETTIWILFDHYYIMALDLIVLTAYLIHSNDYATILHVNTRFLTVLQIMAFYLVMERKYIYLLHLFFALSLIQQHTVLINNFV